MKRSIAHACLFAALTMLLWLIAPRLDNPAFLGQYGHEILLDVGINITLAVSLNLILGMAGQFSLGHAGFLAAGAYTATLIGGRWLLPLLMLFHVRCGISIPTTMTLIMLCGTVAGAAVAAVLGLLVGLPALRLRGDYLAIATLGFGEILAAVFRNTDFFGGATGLSLDSMRREWAADLIDVKPALESLATSVTDFQDNTTYFIGFFWIYFGALLTIFIVRNIKYATSGRALLAIREDVIASEAVGVPTTRYKVAAFVIGAALAGMAGGFYSHHKTLMNPESFRFMRSIEIVAMVILGGQGSITGAIAAAAVLTLLPEALRSGTGAIAGYLHSMAQHFYVAVPGAAGGAPATQPRPFLEATSVWLKALDVEKWRMVLYSLALIFAMLFRPQGIFSRFEINDLIRRIFRRKPLAPPCPPIEAGAPPKKSGSANTTIASGKSGAPTGPLLDVRNAGISFGGLRAVDKFNLQLQPGELVGLIGPNGAGKTTVFNLLTGVYRPTDGQILFRQRSIGGRKPHVISRSGAARTFQNIRLFANLSVLDNVMIAQHAHQKQGIPAAVLRVPAFFREEAHTQDGAMELLSLFALQHLACEQANSLSYGDQRRLEIARALAAKPQLLLLDEPAAGMNPTEKRQLMDLIRQIRDQFSLTILLIEHDMKVVMGICQRIVVLDYGKTIAQGTPDAIRRDPAVIAAYLGASAKSG